MMAASVPCSDIERSIDFYTKGLGMELTGKVEMGRVTEVTLNFPGGGPYLILQHPRDANIPLPIRSPLSRIGISTPDLKALEGRLTAAGYRLERPINELKQYHVAVGQVEDPDGNHIELVQRTR
jgi:lactoylglutathione lyase